MRTYNINYREQLMNFWGLKPSNSVNAPSKAELLQVGFFPHEFICMKSLLIKKLEIGETKTT